jgi:hypothetical protein
MMSQRRNKQEEAKIMNEMTHPRMTKKNPMIQTKVHGETTRVGLIRLGNLGVHHRGTVMGNGKEIRGTHRLGLHQTLQSGTGNDRGQVARRVSRSGVRCAYLGQ